MWKDSFPGSRANWCSIASTRTKTRIDVTIDADALKMPSPDQVALLRSAAYFDTEHHPTERFVSTSIEALSPSHYLVRGMLRIRGVTHEEVFDAVVENRAGGTSGGPDALDFVVTGKIRRSAFGMVADQAMLSDTVRLSILFRLAIEAAPHAG